MHLTDSKIVLPSKPIKNPLNPSRPCLLLPKALAKNHISKGLPVQMKLNENPNKWHLQLSFLSEN